MRLDEEVPPEQGNEVDSLSEAEERWERSSTEEKLAYAAGFLDADGSVSIHDREGRQHSLMVYVRVSQAGEPSQVPVPLQLFQSEWGGGVHRRKRRTSGRKDMYYWHLAGPGLESFLDAVCGYLKKKWRQADLALEALSFRNKPGSTKIASARVISRRKEISREIRKLNMTGRTETLEEEQHDE